MGISTASIGLNLASIRTCPRAPALLLTPPLRACLVLRLIQRPGSELCGQTLSPTDNRLRTLPPSIHDQSVDPARWQYCGHAFEARHRWHGEVCRNLQNNTIKYAFQTCSWLEAGFRPVLLKTVHRQNNPEWIKHLRNVAGGGPALGSDSSTLDKLESLRRPLTILPSGVRPTRLYARRADVDGTNSYELARLPGSEHSFCAVDSASCYKYIVNGRLGTPISGPKYIDNSRLPRHPEHRGQQLRSPSSLPPPTLEN